MLWFSCRYKKFYMIFIVTIVLSAFLIVYISQVLNSFLETQLKNRKLNGRNRIPQIVGHYMAPFGGVNVSKGDLNF